jgi:hypothetical protein
VRPFAFLVFDRAGLSTLARASGRRLQIDTCCLSGEPVRGAFAHVGTLSDSDAALRFDEHEVQQARRDVLASWIPLLGADLCASPPAPLMPAGTGRDHRGAAPGDRFGDDPFARLFPGTLMETDLFAEAPPPPGPVIERYAGLPWPGGGF